MGQFYDKAQSITKKYLEGEEIGIYAYPRDMDNSGLKAKGRGSRGVWNQAKMRGGKRDICKSINIKNILIKIKLKRKKGHIYCF